MFRDFHHGLLGPILWENGIGSDVMKPIAALLLIPIFFAMLKERALRHGSLQPLHETGEEGV